MSAKYFAIKSPLGTRKDRGVPHCSRARDPRTSEDTSFERIDPREDEDEDEDDKDDAEHPVNHGYERESIRGSRTTPSKSFRYGPRDYIASRSVTRNRRYS